METRLHFDILAQPDETTCGPTCLHAVYRYFDDVLPLPQLIAEVGRLEGGGTLAVFLGCHALRRGYRATIYTFNLQVFDPTWFKPGAPPLHERLEAQRAAKDSPKLHEATAAYLEFLGLGGCIRMEDLTGQLISRYLKKSIPVLTGLSATYLYAEPREIGVENDRREIRYVPDDVNGEPAGHFVVLCGYDREKRRVLVADPLMGNPFACEHLYQIGMDRVRCAILLGIVTYDANLLVIEPPSDRKGNRRARTDCL